ncbi:MAG TPA: rRNA maturation RNase YbeY [Candidatus Dormibacteraeota bacterium]
MQLSVAIIKAVRAPVTTPYLRSVLASAAAVPEVTARLPAAASLTLRVTGDRELRRLNREFLGEDHATDVLSFPAGSPGDPYLGDIALSWPMVVRQAGSFGHPVEVEAALLSVHGLLHLLGWDHRTVAEEREMWRLTRVALAAAGISGLASRRI